jgi:hypothetical protein
MFSRVESSLESFDKIAFLSGILPENFYIGVQRLNSAFKVDIQGLPGRVSL